MSSVSSRTAYVLLASVEDEFRSIVDHFAKEQDPRALVSEDLFEAANERRARDGLQNPAQNLAQILPYLDFHDSYELANSLGKSLPAELREGLQGLSTAVGKITGIRNRVAHNRPLDVDDLPAVVDFARDLSKIGGWQWAKVRETEEELNSDPGYIFRAAAQLIVDPDSSVANNLPTPDFDETSLLGRKDERRQIMRALRGSWPVISILGDGGIGKTALALQVCYDLVEQSSCPFEAIVWVTAKNAQLTSTEIIRIESAVEDSLGLFASATEALGGTGDSSQSIDELLGVLESFPTLLVLDNVETVLDEKFPQLLRDIPLGSKVLITSRIGVKTENPYRLAGLSLDDAVKLIRILARARGIDLEAIARHEDLTDWARSMNCHPAYIKWFISGLQSGQLPERLLSDNGLVLDYCMSNVFDYLGPTAKAALRAMLVVPGSHTMAELAFLTDLDSSQIQQVVLELTTTNFVTQVRSGASGTALELSDFARSYLRRSLSIDGGERQLLTEKQKQLYTVGGGLKAAHALYPFSADTIDVRGVGDYSAAKHLREALDFADQGRIEEGLRLCAEAAELAPGYHEAARVEAYLHERSTNFGEAFEAYSRAKDLAPEDSYVAYFFGEFLVRSGFNPSYGLRELQRAANLEPESALLQLAIADAHLSLGDPRSAMDAAAYAVGEVTPTTDKINATYVLWRASAFQVQALSREQNWAQAAEDVEFAVGATQDLSNEDLSFETLDFMLWIEGMARSGSVECAENYIASRLVNLGNQLRDGRMRVDSEHEHRAIGTVTHVDQKGFGFLRSSSEQHYFHASGMWDRRLFDDLTAGSIVAFTPGDLPTEGKPHALSVNWIG
ncbi:NB-ARC domain-containing protein [Arthrobacter sp. TB 23]|uniref:NB-ARC domain-containing protein n=1 Tax=Arthrobacter sp. TB 23 TaxID=494419 RepID=UPI0003051EEB|nr:NB-ARC domain-containing protein [Arthrobacter sp. TB 23]